MVFDEFRKMVRHFVDVVKVVGQSVDLDDWPLHHQLEEEKKTHIKISDGDSFAVNSNVEEKKTKERSELSKQEFVTWLRTIH